ncbi:DEAD/DEAH box helicase [Imhoffiella purpurea]|uniref:ATP-dependent RNA helicase RhlB n=1 Tax=Imhoffiella purpurea TaxID=1249627 RepID=W9VF07_9GAMM|nr:DEAD/DEAH box helicase [Imhoffiella purpurea]EXJ15576.1 ATP-dependent RNA helicase RhlB [Imhoffiella purpurea]
MTDTHLTTIRFDSFALDQRIHAGLADAGFSLCTPIQAQTLPIALEGRDVAGQAQTGTGKTAAFLLVLMQRLLSRPAPEPASISRPRALILAPTRELAVQIHKDTLLLARHTGLRTQVVYGGTGYQKQRDDLAAGVDILIGTPGRLIDYFKQHVFDLKGIEVVVLDEADRMFDLGFIKDIRYLFRRMPPPESRLGMLFSATLSYRVTELAYEHMNHPQLVKVEAETITADRVRQCCYMTSNEEKIPLLIGLVRSWEDARIMVFVNTKREADRVWGYLQGNGINTAVLSGDVPQKKRLKLLRDFTEGSLPVLVGTDVAARGLHIPDVSHVVNYDLPEDPEDYVHRIGRTARAGATGDAIGFVCETYAFCLPDIEAYIGSKIPVLPVDAALLAEVDPRSKLRPDRADREARRDGGRKSRRDSPRDGEREGRERRPRKGEPRRTSRDEPDAGVADAASVEPPSEADRPRKPERRRTPRDEPATGVADAAPVESPSEADWSKKPERPPKVEPSPLLPALPIEQAALTSPPPPSVLAQVGAMVEPAGSGAEDETSSEEPKRKRRRRRRKSSSESTGAGTEDTAPTSESVE